MDSEIEHAQQRSCESLSLDRSSLLETRAEDPSARVGMNMDAMPIWGLFIGTILVVIVAIDAGFRLGKVAHRRSEEEKESPISGISGAGVGLLAFMLAFTFSIVSERHDARKGLVREDANAVRTAYRRADFLPEPDRSDAKRLLREYLDARVAFAQAGSLDDTERVGEFLSGASRAHDRLWDMAVAHAYKDLNSDVAALYIESLNEIMAVHANRVEIGVQARVPVGIWVALYGLTGLCMMIMGYHAGITGSRRSMSAVLLAVAFALVIAMIASLDRPGGFIKVTQRPLIDLQRSIAPEAHGPGEHDKTD